jgi:hypothetical protein
MGDIVYEMVRCLKLKLPLKLFFAYFFKKNDQKEAVFLLQKVEAVQKMGEGIYSQ